MPVGRCGQWVVRPNWSPRTGEPEGGWTRAESRKASRLRRPLAGHREVARVWAAAGASARASHGALPGCPGPWAGHKARMGVRRQTSVRDRGGLREGGSGDLERRGRCSEKRAETTSSWAQFNEPSLCFLNGLCSRGPGLSACSGHLISTLPTLQVPDK